MAERRISIGRESLKVFFILGALAYLQAPPLGGSRDEKWRAQWIRKRSVSWNLPKLSQLWRCNGGFGPCTAQNHLQTKQFVSGTWNSSRVAACALRNEEAGRGHLAETVERVRETFVRSPQKSTKRTSRELQMQDRNLECLSLCWCAPLRRDHHGYCTAGVGKPGGTYE